MKWFFLYCPNAQVAYCLWYVTLMTWLPSPKANPAVFSFALIAPVSLSYSTNAIPLLPGTNLTSLKPSYLPNIIVNESTSYSSGRFWTKIILFGGRYSSGITAAEAGFEDLRPAPLVALIGPAAADGGTPTAAERFNRFCSSRASAAFFLSAKPPFELAFSAYLKRGVAGIPFSANRLLLWLSNSSSSPLLFTLASLLVFANANCIGFSKSSKPCTSSMAFCADSTLSNTMNACPLAFKLVLATISIISPYSEKSSVKASLSCSMRMRSSRFLT